jgi:hypothetical protein
MNCLDRKCDVREDDEPSATVGHRRHRCGGEFMMFAVLSIKEWTAIIVLATFAVYIGLALLFITLLYTTAPAFARTNLLQEIPGKAYAELPTWFQTWENTDMLFMGHKDGDGKVKYCPGKPFEKKPKLLGEAVRVGDKDVEKRGPHGQRLWSNSLTDNDNELYIVLLHHLLPVPATG